MDYLHLSWKQKITYILKRIALSLLATWFGVFTLIGVLSVIVGYALLILSPFIFLAWIIKYFAGC